MAVDSKKIHRLSLSKNEKERLKAVKNIKPHFPELPDKFILLSDLHRLISDENENIKLEAASALLYALSFVSGNCVPFSPLLDKSVTWKDLHKSLNDKDSEVRANASLLLGHVFFNLENKSVAWKDLHKLLNDNDSNVRLKAAMALYFVLPFIPKEHERTALKDLYKLKEDSDLIVKKNATDVFDSLFSSFLNYYQEYTEKKLCFYLERELPLQKLNIKMNTARNHH